MAHFAKLDENNIVRQVVVVADSVATDEAAGIAFLESLYGTEFNWKQNYCKIERYQSCGQLLYQNLTKAILKRRPSLAKA